MVSNLKTAPPLTAEAAADLVWEARKAETRAPDALRGRVALEDAYRAQRMVAERLLAAGDRQTGWKIAGNSPNFRQRNNGAGAMSGYLFASAAYASGARIDFETLTAPPMLESEICLIMGQALGAPAVSASEAAAAIEAVAPAFEIPCLPAPKAGAVPITGLDIPMCVADNAYNMGYVIGAPVRFSREMDLAGIQVEQRRNGVTTQASLARESLDDLFQSLAWLASHLHRMGLAIEAGQHIMGGNCVPEVMRASKGEVWQTSFSSIGSVEIAFD